MTIEAPDALLPDEVKTLRVTYSTPIGALYRIEWLASRGTLLTPPAGSAGAAGAAGLAGTAGTAGTAGAAAGAGGAGLAGGGGAGGGGTSGAGGLAGLAGAGLIVREPAPAGFEETSYKAPDSEGETQITATAIRTSGDNDSGPASCSVSKKITVSLTANAAGAAGSSGGSGQSGSAGEASGTGGSGAGGGGGGGGADALALDEAAAGADALAGALAEAAAEAAPGH